MVSLLGNPPKDFLERSEYSVEFFDDDGEFIFPRIIGGFCNPA